MKKLPKLLEVRSQESGVRSQKSFFQAPISKLLSPSSQKGFTLIEIIVAIGIMAALIGATVFVLDPFGQINKGRDAARQQDLQEIKSALALYYQDNNCYPASVSTFTSALASGSEWTEEGAIYMKEIPQDPTCSGGGGTCYEYITDDASACPQWNVLFAKLTRDSSLATICPLSSLSEACVPSGYDSTWACTISGAADCSLLAQGGVGAGSGTPTPTPIPGPTGTPTPTPIPSGGSVTYAIGNPSGTNPDVYQATIDPLYQIIGAGQKIDVSVDDSTSDIISVTMNLYADNGTQNFTLSRTSGTPQSGVWSGTWQVTDTYNNFYGYLFMAADANGNKECGKISVVGYVPSIDSDCSAFIGQ